MKFAVKNTIQASPEAIWALLTDAERMPSWNPTVASIEGTIAPGEKITVRTTANPKQAFPVKVETFEPSSRMIWGGGMPLGLFRGQRTYTLTPVDGGTEFSMVEEFTGLMAPLITRSIPDLQPDFDTYAAALKEAAEAG